MNEPDFLTRTRSSYDTLAAPYAEWIRHLMAASPWDRAVLGAFADRITGRGPVLDAGCGEGRISAHLATYGLEMVGVDLSPRMIELARAAHPQLVFEVGTLTALDAPDASYEAVVAWYSLIHVPPDALPQAVAELVRVLQPGGWLLVAFQTGGGVERRTELAGYPVALDFHRLDLGAFGRLLDEAGVEIDATTVRAPDADLDERVSQAYVLARKRA